MVVGVWDGCRTAVQRLNVCVQKTFLCVEVVAAVVVYFLTVLNQV